MPKAHEDSYLTSLACLIELLGELDRADVVEAGDLPHGVVRMCSMVEYRSNDGQQRRVFRGYPGEAEISLEKISILTPIGTALIGLSAGQSIDWTARDEPSSSSDGYWCRKPGVGDI